MADKNVTQFTALAAAPAAGDVIYIADLSEAVLDDQNKKITADNLFHFMEGGNYTGSIVLASGETITVASDTDAVSILGRVKLGYDGTNADIAVIGHFDFFTANSYALAQSNNGSTYVNAASGQGIELRVNNSAIFGVNASGLIGAAGARLTQFDNDLAANSATRGVTQAAVVAGIATPTISDFTSAQHDHADAAGGGNLGNVTTGNITSAAGVISMGSDTDTTHVFGRGKFGYDGSTSDVLFVGHFDHFTATNVGFRQNSLGATNIGVPTGQDISLMLNNTRVVKIDETGITIEAGHAAAVLSARPDQDTTHVLGRGQLGYEGTTSDHFAIAHYDMMSSTNYMIKQNASGLTAVNGATGQAVHLRINNSNIMQVTGSGVEIPAGGALVLTVRDNEDALTILGRAKVGYNSSDSDQACFAHYDHMSATNYAIKQNNAGLTIVNSATGQDLLLAINDVTIFGINASGIIGAGAGARIDGWLDEDDMASDSATSGVTQQSVKAYVDNRTRVITLEAFAPTAAVSTGDGKVAFVVPAELNGLDITAVICGVYDKGVTGTTDVVIRRRRGGVDVDVLSTAVTIGDEWYAADGVINTSNDDLATGDTITVDVDAIHSGTAPNGLTITLECS